MKFIFVFIILILCGILFSCQSNTNSASGVTQELQEETEKCDDIIRDVILSSDFKPINGKELSSLTYFIDEKDGDMIRVGVSTETDENGAANIGWLIVNLKTEEISDITIDPENPVKLSFNKKVFQRIKENCD